jgi:protein SCO1/2
VLGLLAVAGVVSGRAAAATPSGDRPAALRDVGIDQRIGARLPLDARFRDEDGDLVRLGDYFGQQPVLLVPAYYECPMLCTLVLNGVTSALRALAFDVGADFTVVTFSFDPRETPDLARAKRDTHLRAYRRPGAEAGWHFLTGEEADIRRLTEAIGFRYAFDPAAGEYAHASGIVVATPDGTVARWFLGVEYAPRELRLGLVEASERRLGSVVDQLLLFCFRYDPHTGRYSGVAMGAVRAGGVLTLALLAGFVAVTMRRERLRRRA